MAKFKILKQQTVHLPNHHYPIIIGYDLLADVSFCQQWISSPQVMIVTNKTIAPLYLSSFKQMFADKQCDTVILDDGEQYKNAESLFAIYDALIKNNHHRDTTLIALGGGVIGDITGFAAATYQRGVQYVQIPTTLLAQVDASVGGKTAINHPLAKNMIGSFYQPKAVLIDLRTLSTLPARELRAGLAEIIKYGILAGGHCFELIKESILETPERLITSSRLAEVIDSCCKIKANFVEKDEKETGERALLNLGHTVAHALEAYTHYTRWLHGEAVAIGLYCAALLSVEICNFPKYNLDVIEQLLKSAGLPYKIPEDINLDELRRLMTKDKKIKNNTLRFVLIKDLGNCYLEDKVGDKCLKEVLKRAVKGE